MHFTVKEDKAKTPVSYEDVTVACKSLEELDIEPSCRVVKAELKRLGKTCSDTTICKYLREYRQAEHDKKELFMNRLTMTDDLTRAYQHDVRTHVNRAITDSAQQIKQLTGELDEALKIMGEKEEELEAVQEELNQVKTASDDTIRQLGLELAAVQGGLNERDGEVMRLTLKCDSSVESGDACKAELVHARLQLEYADQAKITAESACVLLTTEIKEMQEQKVVAEMRAVAAEAREAELQKRLEFLERLFEESESKNGRLSEDLASVKNSLTRLNDELPVRIFKASEFQEREEGLIEENRQLLSLLASQQKEKRRKTPKDKRRLEQSSGEIAPSEVT